VTAEIRDNPVDQCVTFECTLVRQTNAEICIRSWAPLHVLGSAQHAKSPLLGPVCRAIYPGRLFLKTTSWREFFIAEFAPALPVQDADRLKRTSLHLIYLCNEMYKVERQRGEQVFQVLFTLFSRILFEAFVHGGARRSARPPRSHRESHDFKA
jgi:hypothetical protein